MTTDEEKQASTEQAPSPGCRCDCGGHDEPESTEPASFSAMIAACRRCHEPMRARCCRLDCTPWTAEDRCSHFDRS